MYFFEICHHGNEVSGAVNSSILGPEINESLQQNKLKTCMQFSEEAETLLHALPNFCLSGLSLYQELEALPLHGESNALGIEVKISSATLSVKQAVQQGCSPAKSILQEEIVLVLLSSALFLDVQKPRPVGKRMTRALKSCQGEHASTSILLYKSSNFPVVVISPELVTPPETLICIRISNLETLVRIFQDI